MEIRDKVFIRERSYTKMWKDDFDVVNEVYANDVPSYDVVRHWHNHFKCGRISVETAPIPGRRHSTIDDRTTLEVQTTILVGHRLTIC